MRAKGTNNLNGTRLSRIILLVIVDILVVAASCWGALLLRFEFDITDPGYIEQVNKLLIWVLPFAGVTVLLFALVRLYNSLWDFAGADELIHILAACGIETGILFALVMADVIDLPRSFPILFGMLLLICTMVVRFSHRFFRRTRVNASGMTRTMLIGAGQAGALVLRELSGSRFSHNKVVCIIDDDPAKRGCQLMGVKVVGNRSEIEAKVEKECGCVIPRRERVGVSAGGAAGCGSDPARGQTRDAERTGAPLRGVGGAYRRRGN